MASVASAGTADRIAARIWLNVLRAGSGMLAMYSSTLFGARLAFGVEARDFAFFMERCYQGVPARPSAEQRLLIVPERPIAGRCAGDQPVTHSGDCSHCPSRGQGQK